MEDNIDEDAFHVPPRSEEATDVQASVTQNKVNQREQPNRADNVHNQEENHSNEKTASAKTDSVFSDVNPPHDRWSYNKLLLDISDALTKDDLKRMKSMYEGEIGSGTLEKITDATCLFKLMERRRDLSPINLLTLCGLLYITKRIDLIPAVVDYSRNTENALYVDAPSHSPVNGYTYVEFHVAGRDFTKTTKKTLLEFRNIVSSMLAVPERFVLIDGVSPSSSITITLLLPESQVPIIKTVLEDNKPEIVRLALYGVDRVTIGDKLYHIQAVLSDSIDDEQQQQLDTYQHLQKAISALSDTELENLTLMEKMKDLEKTVVELKAENDVWIRSVKPSGLFPDAEKDHEKSKQTIQNDIENALKDFRQSLGTMSETSYDRQVVLGLLQAHATLIASVCQNQMSSLIVSSNVQLMNILNGMVMTKIVTDLQKFMGIPDFNDVQIFRAINKISSKITPEEQEKLQKDYQWTENEKELLERGIVPFFIVLLRKECEQASECGVDLNESLRKCLKKIDRLDLLQVFEDEKETREVVTERKPHNTEGQKTNTDKQESAEQAADELQKYSRLLIEKIKGEYANLSMLVQYLSKEQNFFAVNLH